MTKEFPEAERLVSCLGLSPVLKYEQANCYARVGTIVAADFGFSPP